jgi:anti-anti-sigma factor
MPPQAVVAPAPGFRIEIWRETTENRVVLVPVGELDLTTTGPLERAVEQLLDDDAREISLDLSRLSFFDSDGLWLLLRLEQRLGEEGRLFTVAPGAGIAARLLRITRLDQRLPTAESDTA